MGGASQALSRRHGRDQAARRVRAFHHHQDGLCRLLPHRVGLHQLVAPARYPRRPRARLGRRQHRRLFHRHHQRRPAALRSPFRALFEPRPRLHARLRRRLLHGPPRGDHRLRQKALPPRERRTDRHLRYARLARRHQGRGARHARPLRRDRPRHQAHGRQVDHPRTVGAQPRKVQEGGHRDGERPRQARRGAQKACRSGGQAQPGIHRPLRERRDLEARHRHGLEARGHAPSDGHARRGRRHLPQEDRRQRAALAQRRGYHHPIRHEGSGVHRHAQDGLSGAHHAHRYQEDARLYQRGYGRDGGIHAGVRRPQGISAHFRRRYGRRVPARTGRHEEVHEAASAKLSRRSHRGHFALPPGAHGLHPRISEEQVGPCEYPLLNAHAQAHFGEDVRRHHLSGAGHADLPEPCGLFAGAGRPRAPRHGEKAPLRTDGAEG